MMKVALVNGSPRKNGCTNAALMEVGAELNKLGVDFDLIWTGTDIKPCLNCRHCKDNKTTCFIKDDPLDYFVRCAHTYDGLIVGSPVYYGGITSQLKNFLTRLFYSQPNLLEFKPCAGITTSRRSGNTTAFAELNMYFLMHSMIVVGSQYWNECYGDTPDEMKHDIEGLQTMRTLAVNMEYVMRCLKDMPRPIRKEKHIHTNFISREYLKLVEKNGI